MVIINKVCPICDKKIEVIRQVEGSIYQNKNKYYSKEGKPIPNSNKYACNKCFNLAFNTIIDKKRY